MKPICVPCQRFFRCQKNGFYFVEGMPEGNARPGLEDAEKWSPYKLWVGDLWRCNGCGATIVVGIGSKQLAEHYEPGFAEQVKRLGAELQVNDC